MNLQLTQRNKEIASFVFLFIFFFSLFASFRSKDLTAVDGGYRSIDVFNWNIPYLDANNHMLYYIHLYYFNHLLGLLGFHAHNGVEYFYNSSLLNVFAASISVAVYFLILLSLTEDLWMSMLGAFLLGFSRAFIINAINPNQAMTGFMLSLLSIWFMIGGVIKDKFLFILLSGFCLSYALATYQSMFFIFPAMVLFYSSKFYTTRRLKDGFNIVLFLISILLGIVIIYGVCYKLFHHYHTFGEYINRFLTIDGGFNGTWGGFRYENFNLTYWGFVHSLFVSFKGLFNCGSIIPVVILALYAYLGLQKDKNAFFIASVMGLFFLFSLLLPFLWIPDYPKLWIQPVAIFFAFTIFVSTMNLRLSLFRGGDPQIRANWVFIFIDLLEL